MKIAIVGGGFTGLSAAYTLVKNGHEVTVFEKNLKCGGFASGFNEGKWKWDLDKYYHHCFTNDNAILDLAKELNFKFIKLRPKTKTYIKEKNYQLDSPLSLLTFPLLSLSQKSRMGAALLYLKLKSNWRNLEKAKAAFFLPRLMGKKGFEIIWKPLFINKFGKYANEISLSWFWARIKKRTTFLTYPEGGFQCFADKLTKEINNHGGVVLTKNEVTTINVNSKIKVIAKDDSGKANTYLFDKIINTLPANMLVKLLPSLPKRYKLQLLRLKSLSAHNLILRLKKKFLKDDTYWLNICNLDSPVTGIVEHTNFINKKFYNNEHIVYLLNYLDKADKRYSMNANQLLVYYDSFLKKIKKNYKKDLIGIKLFKDESAQAIIGINHSKKILPFETPLKNVYIANMDQTYPWDRGTNYAISLGQKIAKLINEKSI